jgi:hypothetical protein
VHKKSFLFIYNIYSIKPNLKYYLVVFKVYYTNSYIKTKRILSSLKVLIRLVYSARQSFVSSLIILFQFQCLRKKGCASVLKTNLSSDKISGGLNKRYRYLNVSAKINVSMESLWFDSVLSSSTTLSTSRIMAYALFVLHHFSIDW